MLLSEVISVERYDDIKIALEKIPFIKLAQIIKCFQLMLHFSNFVRFFQTFSIDILTGYSLYLFYVVRPFWLYFFAHSFAMDVNY